MNMNRVVFERCQSKACVNITTDDDGTAEHPEMFKVVLSRSGQLDNRITLVNREATVTILDSDGKATHASWYNYVTILPVCPNSGICTTV